MFASKQMGWIGVDIGSRAVKVAQLQRSGNRWRLHRAISIPRLADPALGQASLDLNCRAEIAAAVQTLPPFHGKRAACTVSMAKQHVHHLKLPPGAVDERRAMVLGELTALRTDMPDLLFDFWEPQLTAATTGNDVYAIAMAAAEASQVAIEVAGAGLECEVLDGLPLSLARAVQLADPTAEESSVIIDWGYSSATFCLVMAGSPVYVRHLRSCGFQAVVQATANALGLDIHEAEDVLASDGLTVANPAHGEHAATTTSLSQTISDITRSALEEVLQELRKTLSYIAGPALKTIPQRLWLCGGGATIKNIDAVLHQSLGLKVQVWKPSFEFEATPTGAGAVFGNAAALSALRWSQ